MNKTSFAILPLAVALALVLPSSAHANPIQCLRMLATADRSGGYDLEISLTRDYDCIATDEACPAAKDALRLARDGEALTPAVTEAHTDRACVYKTNDKPTAAYGIYSGELDALTDGKDGTKKPRTWTTAAKYGIHPDVGAPDMWIRPRDAATPDTRDHLSGDSDDSDGCSLASSTGSAPLGLVSLLLLGLYGYRRARR